MGAGLLVLGLASSLSINATNRNVSLEDGAAQIEGTEFTGAISPGHQFGVNAAFGGTVRRVLITIGDRVEAGQPLIEIDDQSARRALDAALAEQQYAAAEAVRWNNSIATLDQSIEAINTAFAQSLGALAVAQRQADLVPGRQLRDSPERAQATLEQATAKLHRVRKLHAEGIVSDEALEDQIISVRIAENDLENARQWKTASLELQRAQQEQARQQTARSRADLQQLRSEYLGRLAQAEAQAEQARQRASAAQLVLDNAVVKATSAGVVSAIAVAVGDEPLKGAPLLTIAQLDELIVTVPVAATLVNVLRKGQDAVVLLPTLPQERTDGRITSINPIPSADMTHEIEVTFPNASARLLSGQPARVVFR